MALLDLDRIIIYRKVTGIHCTKCGGNLHPLEKKNLIRKILNMVTFGLLKTKQYECEDCHKRFTVI